MSTLLSLFHPRAAAWLVYMLQQVEYDPAKFLRWFGRLITKNASLTTVQTRKTLVLTRRAQLLMGGLGLVLFADAFGLSLLFLSDTQGAWLFAASILTLPLLYVPLLAVMAFVAHRLVVRPAQARLLKSARSIFAEHKGIKIAVLGSYGKTTMKECLNTVLSQSMRVAATPGNMNVSVSHAKFALSLSGEEEVLIVEFGEGEPGDIARMAEMLRPDYAIVTGLAPNHLDHYENLEAVARDLLRIYDFVPATHVFLSGESAMLRQFASEEAQVYTTKDALGWKIKQDESTIEGLRWTMTKSASTLALQSQLIGSYQLAPLSLIAALADKLGMKRAAIEEALTATKPFEHRMQPRLLSGAWLIDDTYNGNLEGMQAGLQLLKSLKAKRKWYVTPGLVDQGSETERVHVELGQAIAEAAPDIVVLMKNSVCETIRTAMSAAGFNGELRIEEHPLEFYNNIEHQLAAGDLVLMQNDWTDNYS